MGYFGKGITFSHSRFSHWMKHLFKVKDCKHCCFFCEFYRFCKNS